MDGLLDLLCEEGRVAYNGSNFRYVVLLCRNLSIYNRSHQFNSSFMHAFDGEQENDNLKRPEIIVTFVLCVLALLLNIVSIMATSQIAKTSHTKVIISLAASDILVSLSVFMHVINSRFNNPSFSLDPDPQSRLLSACIQVCVVSFNNMANLMSLFNLLAMAVDHFIAILMPYRYVHLLDRRRTNFMIAFLWTVGFIWGFSSFFGGFQKSEDLKYLNFCETTNYSDFHSEYFVIFTAAICSTAMIVIYTRIFCVVRKVSTESTTVHKDGLHNTKALRTSALIVGTFVVCWFPNLVFQISVLIQLNAMNSRNEVYVALFRANRYLYILVVVNSLCDPIIYAARLRIVQKGYFKLLYRYFGYQHPMLLDDIQYSQSKMELLARKRSNEHRESHPEVQTML